MDRKIVSPKKVFFAGFSGFLAGTTIGAAVGFFANTMKKTETITGEEQKRRDEWQAAFNQKNKEREAEYAKKAQAHDDVFLAVISKKDSVTVQKTLDENFLIYYKTFTYGDVKTNLIGEAIYRADPDDESSLKVIDAVLSKGMPQNESHANLLCSFYRDIVETPLALAMRKKNDAVAKKLLARHAHASITQENYEMIKKK